MVSFPLSADSLASEVTNCITDEVEKSAPNPAIEDAVKEATQAAAQAGGATAAGTASPETTGPAVFSKKTVRKVLLRVDAEMLEAIRHILIRKPGLKRTIVQMRAAAGDNPDLQKMSYILFRAQLKFMSKNPEKTFQQAADFPNWYGRQSIELYFKRLLFLNDPEHFSRPPEPKNPLSTRSATFWDRTSDTARANVTTQLRTMKDYLKRRSDKHESFIVQAKELGLSWGDRIDVPSFDDQIAVYAKQMSDHVLAGRLRSDEVIWPALNYRVGDKDLFVTYGSEIPKEAVPMNDGEMTVETLVAMLADKKYPLGAESAAHRDGSAAFLHSWYGHITGSFAHSPEYIRPLIEACQELMRLHLTDGILDKDMGLGSRIAFILESLEIIPEEHHTELAHNLILPKGVKWKTVQSEEPSLRALSELTPLRLKNQATRLLERYPAWIKNYGGESADIFTQHTKDEPAIQSIDSPAQDLREALKAAKAAKTKATVSESLGKLKSEVARFQTLLIVMGKHSADDWVHAWLNPDFDYVSPIFEDIEIPVAGRFWVFSKKKHGGKKEEAHHKPEASPSPSEAAESEPATQDEAKPKVDRP